MQQHARRMTPGYGLFLLFLANFLNYADRALLGIVIDPVKADLLLSDTEMSIVSGTAFVFFNLLMGIFIARWVDFGNRRLILTIGVVLWSGATALTGMAVDFWSLALTRVLVGVGEAAAFPVAISMIGDLFVGPKRPRAISVFHASTFVGLVLGSIVAGVLAAAEGWRNMFIVCGLAGFVLVAMLLLTMREPARVRDNADAGSEPAADALPTNLAQAVSRMIRQPGYVPLALAMAFAGTGVTVLPTWAPAFLLRSHDVPLASVGALIGPAVGIGGILGTLTAGFAATYLVRRRGNDIHAMLVPLIAVPFAAPFFLLFIMTPSLTQAMSFAAVMNFLLGSAMPPCIAVAIAISPSNMRALSSTLMLITSGVIGGALAPLVVGMVSDMLEAEMGTESLRFALGTMAPMPLLAGVLLWFAYRQMRAAAPALWVPRPGLSSGQQQVGQS